MDFVPDLLIRRFFAYLLEISDSEAPLSSSARIVTSLALPRLVLSLTKARGLKSSWVLSSFRLLLDWLRMYSASEYCSRQLSRLSYANSSGVVWFSQLSLLMLFSTSSEIPHTSSPGLQTEIDESESSSDLDFMQSICL